MRWVSAEHIATALGGRRVGGGWMACCPTHDDREPSLAIVDGGNGKVLLCCHAGCDQGSVIAALRSRCLWEPAEQFPSRTKPAAGRVRVEPNGGCASRSEAALALWRASQSAKGTPVETYLRSRGLTVPVPPSVRFQPRLRHPTAGVWPAMIALVTRGVDGTPIGIHRTFLACDGNGKAPVEPAKMMLGPCRGGAVRLGPPGDFLMIGEGIETCLAAMQATRSAVWAALSTSGLRSLELPRELRDVVVLADGDKPGEAAAQDCAWRWKREGRRVRIARPPQGMDFNDLLVRRAPQIDGAAQ